MQFLFITILVLLILTLPLGGFEILTGGRFALWSAWCRPTLTIAAKWVVQKIPAPIRRILLIIWFVVFFVVATPVAILINYVVLWFTLMTETWGNTQLEVEEPVSRWRDHKIMQEPVSTPLWENRIFKRSQRAPATDDDRDDITIGPSSPGTQEVPLRGT